MGAFLVMAALIGGRSSPVRGANAPVTVSAANELNAALRPVMDIWVAREPSMQLERLDTPSLLKQLQKPLKDENHVWVLSADPSWLTKGGVTLSVAGEITGETLVAVGTKGAFTQEQRAELGEALLAPGVPTPERLATLARLVMGPIAVPHPASGAAGTTCRAALSKLDIWKPLEPTLIFKKSPNAILHSVAEGESALGILFASQTTGVETIDHLGEFSQQIHPPVRFTVFHGGGTAAKRLVDFLASPAATMALEKVGLAWRAQRP